jgi:plastocyanin
MRKLIAAGVAVLASTVITAGTALADAPSRSTPPVSLPGKVNNKGTKSVKKGKITIEANDYYFKATFEKAKPGSTVTVSLKNKGTTEHTFTTPGLGIDQTLTPGQKATVQVTLPASGATQFYCRFHGPNGTSGDLGMQGAFFPNNGATLTTSAAAPAGTSPPAPTTAAVPTTTARPSGGMGY